jgi:hypothetical protein
MKQPLFLNTLKNPENTKNPTPLPIREKRNVGLQPFLGGFHIRHLYCITL